MAWQPNRFSNAAAPPMRLNATAERRYVPTGATRLPDSDAANAGQVERRPGERVSGWAPSDARDLLDDSGADIAAGDGFLGGRISGMNDIARVDVRGIARGALAGEMGTERAPISRRELAYGTYVGESSAPTNTPTNTPAAGTAAPMRGAVRQAGSGGTVGGVRTAALWSAAAAAPQEPTAAAGRPTAPPRNDAWGGGGAVWPTLDRGTLLAPALVSPSAGFAPPTEVDDVAPSRPGYAYVPGAEYESGAANRGRAPPSDMDLRVAANGMAWFPPATGPYPEGDLGAGLPRRADLGLSVAHAAQTVAWRGLTAAADGGGPTVVQSGVNAGGASGGQGIAGGALNRALVARGPRANLDAMWNDGVFGMGDGVDAVFVGVEVDPYTGVEYDVYENAAPPPQKDLTVRDSGMQRQFEALFGGSAPGRPVLKRQEIVNDWSEAYPDAPDRDWVEYARARGAEAARREDFLGPHRDDAAWRDGEGYASLPRGDMPYNKVGYNDAVTFLPLPDLHVHRGLEATPMTGGGVDPGPGAHAEGGFQRPQVAVRVKRAPVFSVHGGSGGSHLDGGGTGGLAEWEAVRRAPMRVGEYGEHGVDGAVHAGGGTGGLAEWEAVRRAPMRVGEYGEHGLDGAVHAGGGTGGLAEWEAVRRAPMRVGAHGEHGVDGAMHTGPHAPPDVVTEQLSRRPQMVAALGRAFTNLMLAADGAWMPPEHVPPSLRRAATDPMSLGRAIIDLGLAGPGTGGLADYSALKATRRATDMRAMAVGDVGMSMLGDAVGGGGSYMPPEVHELSLSERDALSVALGRAMLHLVDAAHYEAGHGGFTKAGAPLEAWGTTFEETLRAPAVVNALGALAVQLADDAGAMYAPPGDWDAPQSKGRDMPARASVEAVAALGRRLAGVVSQVEASGTGGLATMRDPLRLDSVLSAVLGRGAVAEVEGAGGGALLDPAAVRARKLDAYAAAIAARLYGLNAGSQVEAGGTGGLTEYTRRNRASRDAPNLRGSAPFRIVDGSDGLRIDTGGMARTNRAARDPGANSRVAGAEAGTDAMPAAQPTRGEDFSTRYGHRFGGGVVATRADNYVGGAESAYADDYSEVDSRFSEVECNA